MRYNNKLSLENAIKQFEDVENNCGLDDAVLQAFKERKVIFFLGAGVSRLEGIKGWDDFSNTLIKKAFPLFKEREELLRAGLSSKEKITIAYEKFITDDRLEEFNKEFKKALEPDPNVKHIGIYETLSKFNVNFFTTNADLLFENVLGKELCHTEFDVSKLINTTHISRNQLFYLHGRCSDGIDTLVFTTPQYVQRYNDPNFCNFLKKIFSNPDYAIFFIGYGLNEYELIDYIAAKTGIINEGGMASIYALMPFFSYENVLFKARRSYFESLGIKLLPYCKDEGYEKLYEVLNKLLVVFQSQLHVLHDDYEDIKYYLNRDFSGESKRQLDIILNRNILDGRFSTACDALKSSPYRDRWGKEIISDLTWFPKYSYDDYLGWHNNAYCRVSLLFYLIANSDNGDLCFMRKAKELLDWVFTQKPEQINDSLGALLNYYVNMVCCLNDDLVNDNYFLLIEKILNSYGIYFIYYGIQNGIKIMYWSDKHISKLVYSFLNGINVIDKLIDDEALELNNIFNKNNKIEYNHRISKSFFDGAYGFVTEYIRRETYSKLRYVNNLDNLKKAYHFGWAAILEMLISYFNGIEEEIKRNYISAGLHSDDEIICKIWIYILRKTIKDLSLLVKYGTKCFDYHQCICELYLLICEADKSQYAHELEKIIAQSNLGLDSDYFDNEYMLRRKNSFMKAIGFPVDGDVEDIEGIADKCDYVHRVQIERLDIEELSLPQILERFAGEEKEYKLIELIEVIITKLVTASEYDFATNLKKLETFVDKKINLVVLHCSVNLNLFSQEKQALLCRYITKLLLGNFDYTLLYKNCFMFLARADLAILYGNSKEDFKRCWEKWNNIPLGEPLSGVFSKNFFGDLINTAEYEKVSFFCNYWITRNRVEHLPLSNEEIAQIKTGFNNDTFKRCMACRFWYISLAMEGEDHIDALMDAFVVMRDDKYDYIALYLIIVSFKNLYKHLTQLIVSSKLLEDNDFLDKCDNVSAQSFYLYVSSAYFNNQLELKDLVPLFKNKKFYDAVFLSIAQEHNKVEHYFIDKFFNELWPQIKQKISEDNDLIRYVLRSMRMPIYKSIDNVGFVKIAIELLELCVNGQEEIIIESNKLIDVYKNHKEEGKKYIELTLLKSKYTQFSSGAIEQIIKYFIKDDKQFAIHLVTTLKAYIPFELSDKLICILESDG